MSEPTLPPYTPPKARLSVAFAATDGSMPESIEVEWAYDPGVALLAVLRTVLAAPAERRDGQLPHQATRLLRTEG